VTLLAEIISNREIAKEQEDQPLLMNTKKKQQQQQKKKNNDTTTANDNNEPSLPCHVALDLIMDMKLPATLLEKPKKKKKKKGGTQLPQTQEEQPPQPVVAPPSESTNTNNTDTNNKEATTPTAAVVIQPENPWPTFCDWVFLYPENCLYHVQFLRLFRSICLDHHESTLKLVLQTCKFVTRSIRAMESTPSLRGLLLSCLNILRLRCQSLGPHEYLHHFLDSHDVWKGFQTTLHDYTMKQQQPLVSIIPGRENETPLEYDGIDLNSRYASQLGLGAFTPYVESSTTTTHQQQQQSTDDAAMITSNEGSGETTKSKKKKKKKKKK